MQQFVRRHVNTNVPGSFHLLFHEQKFDAIDNFLFDIDIKVQDLDQRGDSTSHYQYNTAEEITIVGSQIIPQKTASLWNKYFLK
jgi:hypothetical protein